MSDTPRAVLYSMESEQAVLGSVLINSDALADVMFLASDDFHVIKHRWVWDVIMRLHERHEPIDVHTVSRGLEDAHRLDEFGGMAYLITLLNAVPTHLHAGAYARLVKRDSVRRATLAAAGDVANLAYDDALSIDELVSRAASRISVLRSGDDRDLSSARELTAEYADEIERRMSRLGMADTLTGLASVDRIIVSFDRGNLIYVAARTGLGKTSLMLGTAVHEAKRGRRVAVFSLEMSRHEVADRLMAMESLISLTDLRTGQISDMAVSSFTRSSRDIASLPLFVDDTTTLTPLSLAAKVRRAELTYGRFDLVIVDYVQLMSVDRGGKKYSNRYEEVTEISRMLKVLAGDLGVTVMAGAQLNRAIDQRADKRPTLSDLRDSGGLEQDANVVMFIHVPDPLISSEREIIVAKNRQGATGTAAVIFDGPHTRFMDAQTIDLRQVN